MSVKSDVVQSYNFKITGTGGDPSATQHSVSVSFSTKFEFGISNQSGVQSIAAGATATYDLDVSPTGSTFPQSVSFSCSGLPVESTCAFSPSKIAAGSGETPVTFSISTTAPVLAQQKSNHARRLIFYCSLLPILGVLLASAGRCTRRRAGLALLLVIVIGEIACGGGSSASSNSSGSGQPGTPPGTYTVTVTATMGSQTNSAPVQLTVN
jgi:hypothetical protein